MDQEKSRLLQDVILGLAFHDVGKAAAGFQKVMRGEQRNWGGKRHEILSASFASSFSSVNEAVIFAILTHHKSIPNSGFDREERKALNYDSLPLDDESESLPYWKRMKDEWSSNYESFLESWEKICKEIGRIDLIQNKSLSKIRVDRSWLRRGNGPKSQLNRKSYEERRYFSLLRGLLIASDHMASAGYFPSDKPFLKVTETIPALRQRVGGNFHQFQLKMLKNTGDVILRAPTGSGKTEAALLWFDTNRRKNSRLFYALPNIASINAMFQRLQAIYGSDSVGLLHSRARDAIYRQLMSEDDAESRIKDERNAAKLSTVARSIWFPIRVCTPHQILRFSLRGKYWETMLAEFPNSVFVFDEIHAYDPRLVGQIIATARLVHEWGAKCAFISATMPSFLIELVTKHMTLSDSSPRRIPLDDDRTLVEKKRHRIIIEEGTLLDQIDRIVMDAEHGLSVLVVCNTISASQEVFRKISEQLGKQASKLQDKDVILLHSRFTRQDRAIKESGIMNESTRPRVLVATQVVEVSLDISYDSGYFEPAPIDAIVQRMGRVNRKGERPEPSLIHMSLNEISTHSVYANRERVKRTIEELWRLSSSNQPLSENDIILAAENVYVGGYNADETDLFQQGISNRELSDFKAEMIAGCSEDWKDKVLVDSWGIDVLPFEYANRFKEKLEQKLFIQAYSLLAPIQWNSRIREEADYSHELEVFVSSWAYSPIFGFKAPSEDPWDDDLIEKAPVDPANVI